MSPNGTRRGAARSWSVVVPAHARPQRLAHCLAALAQVEPPPGGVEVVVVDDGSPVPLAPAVAGARERLDVRVVRQANTGPAGARNAGAAAAGGDALAFTDDDCAPGPGWLRALDAALDADPGALLGGRIDNALTGNPFSEASQLLVGHLYDAGRDRSGSRFFASANVALDRGAFLEAGGFDTSFPLAAGEDREFCDRWAALGRPLRYVPDAVVAHRHALTLRTYLRQHANYGRGAYRFRIARARREAEPVRLEPPRFYLDLLASPFDGRPARRAALLTGLLALSQVANAAGFLVEHRAARRGAGG